MKYMKRHKMSNEDKDFHIGIRIWYLQQEYFILTLGIYLYFNLNQNKDA